MEHRRLGTSGLKVPALSFGTGGFGVTGPSGRLGGTGVREARRLVDLCLDAGVTMFDSSDVYSAGAAEEVLGEALRGRRDRALIATKTSLPLGEGPGDWGSSRLRLVRACEDALRRLGTDRIDLFQMHAFDASTPVEEVLSALDDLVRAGKVRYTGASNFAGWELMKSLAAARDFARARYASHQVYYSLLGRDYEWELMPLSADQGVGALVWSPLCWGRLTGKIRRGRPAPEGTRVDLAAAYGPPVDDEDLYRVVDALDGIAAETGRTVAQVALNWLVQRPTVASVLIGARDEEQLRENLGAAGWELTPDQAARLEKASAPGRVPYPRWLYERQSGFARLNPAMTEPSAPPAG